MGWNVCCAYLLYCVRHILFSMILDMDVRCATYSVRLAMDNVEEHELCLQACRGGW